MFLQDFIRCSTARQLYDGVAGMTGKLADVGSPAVEQVTRMIIILKWQYETLSE